MRGLLLILPVLLVSGCTAVDAPSLSPRPAEKLPVDPPAPYAEAAEPVDPALAGRLAPIVAQAEEGHRGFTAARQAAEKAAAAAGKSGSESWIVAQQALSALDATRGPVQQAESALDAIRVDPAYAGPGNRAAIDAAGTRIQALVDEESSVMAGLATKLG
jgi:hypothetical protein